MFYLHTHRFGRIGFFLLIPFITFCKSSNEIQKAKVVFNQIEVNEAKSPKELLLLLRNCPEMSPEQYMVKFKSNRDFDKWLHLYPSQMAKVISRFPLKSSFQYTTRLFTHWADKSYDASEAYIINELNSSPLRDSAIEGMVNGLKSDHLSTAVAWAHEIKDESKRYQLLESLATH